MRETDESQDPFQLCGTTIEGKYRIASVIGDGGFGVVYRGVHQGFDEPVAIKCLKLPSKLDPKERESLLEQLRDEGRLLLRLSRATSGIVQALDIGSFTTPEGIWVPYLILEWLEGETLAQHVRKRLERGEGPLRIAEAVKLLEPAARALAVAHSQKVAHRDVKPQNLFITQVGSKRTLKVLDFGIAKVLSDHPTFTQALAATKLGPTAFTPRYGAPEQFNKKRGATGPWTDVFALALIVVELASGKHALEGDDPTELYIASADPAIRPTLRNRGVSVPEPIERVLDKALSVEPKHRYPDASEFWDALTAAVAAHDPGAVTGATRESQGGAPADHTMLSTAEFAAARSLDVGTEAPELAATELAVRRVEPTMPMTSQPSMTEHAPRLDPTVPASPAEAPEAGVTSGRTSEPAKSAERQSSAPTLDAPTRAIGATGTPGTTESTAASVARTIADASNPTAPPALSAAAATSKSAPPSAAASTRGAAPADAAPKTTRRADDPMAETPLHERAPTPGSRKKPADEAEAPEPQRASPPPEKARTSAAVAKPVAEQPPAAGKRSSWIWVASGLAAAAIAGGVLLTRGGDESSKPAAPTAKPRASAPIIAKPKVSAKAIAAASASAAPTASAAPVLTVPDDMVYIPPGTWKMGEGDSTREVTLSRGFFIERNEVTVHAYQACMAKRMCSSADHVVIPAEPEPGGIEGALTTKEFAETWTRRCNEPRKALDNPINCVDYSSAESFCRWRGRRLPTEAEWERAARGLEGRAYAWGSEAPDCGRSCFGKNGECLGRGENVSTCMAGGRPNDKTPEGVYDLAGNVSEWVSDGFAAAPAGGADPKGDPAAPLRVVRGGSFLDPADKLRATFRMNAAPSMAHVSIGFRCAMDAPSTEGTAGAPTR